MNIRMSFEICMCMYIYTYIHAEGSFVEGYLDYETEHEVYPYQMLEMYV